METVTQQTVHQQRAAALTAIAQLADHHGLPTPQALSFFGEASSTRDIDIRIDNDRKGSVQAWARLLGLRDPKPTPVRAYADRPAWTSYGAEAGGGYRWLGFDSIRVWSKCAAEPEPAGYAREIDNADEQVPVPPGVEGGRVGAGPGRHTETPKEPS